jgi:hypothetical protein
MTKRYIAAVKDDIVVSLIEIEDIENFSINNIRLIDLEKNPSNVTTSPQWKYRPDSKDFEYTQSISDSHEDDILPGKDKNGEDIG